jgi:VanZ family protein
MFASRIRRGHFLILGAALIAAYLFAGLWPFKPRVKNNLGWQPGKEGTFFGWLSSVYSERELDLGRSALASGQPGTFSIELYLQSEHKPTGEVGAILSLYDGELPANLVIAQWRSELLLRSPVRNARGRRVHREVSVRADLRLGIRRFAVITSGAGGTSFYVDGKIARDYPKLILRPETLHGRLVIGDAPEGNSRWAGKMIGVAIFSRTLDAADVSRHHGLWTGADPQELSAEPGLEALYLFGERSGPTIPDRSDSGNPLLIPEHYRTFRKTVLVPPWRDPRPYFSDTGDVVNNVLGFIPLGLFFFFYRSRVRPGRTFLNIVLTVAVSGITSLAIELIQVYLPTRSSSLTDVLCNITGGLVGGLFAAAAISFARTPRKLTQD